jgi:hypothetical protein
LVSLASCFTSLTQKGNGQYTLLDAYHVPQIHSLHLFISVQLLLTGIEKALIARASELDFILNCANKMGGPRPP